MMIGDDYNLLVAFYDFLVRVDGFTQEQIAEIDSNKRIWNPEYQFWLENRVDMESGKLPNGPKE